MDNGSYPDTAGKLEQRKCQIYPFFQRIYHARS